MYFFRLFSFFFVGEERKINVKTFSVLNNKTINLQITFQLKHIEKTLKHFFFKSLHSILFQKAKYIQNK